MLGIAEAGVAASAGVDFGPLPTVDGHIEMNDDGTVRIGGEVQATIPTPFGDLLVTLPSVLEIVTPGAGGNVPLPLPNSASLVGAKVTWQNFFFDFTGPIFGASNGVEWLIGEQ